MYRVQSGLMRRASHPAFAQLAQPTWRVKLRCASCHIHSSPNARRSRSMCVCASVVWCVQGSSSYTASHAGSSAIITRTKPSPLTTSRLVTGVASPLPCATASEFGFEFCACPCVYPTLYKEAAILKKVFKSGVKYCEPRDFGSTGGFYKVFRLRIWIDRRLFRSSKTLVYLYV